MIKTSYDPQADIFATKFAAPNSVCMQSEEVAPGENRLVGVDVMYVLKRLAGELGARRTKQAVE